MALANAAELAEVLAGGDRLGRVFARHAFGMRAWVDLFAARIPLIADPDEVVRTAAIVADNARHMALFRERALAHGVDPDAYTCPYEGEAIYARLDEVTDPQETLGYALGSLDHFAELLAVYRAAASGRDAEALDVVIADNDRTREVLRGLAGPAALALAEEAHELYRVRELAETPTYAHGG